MQSTTKPIASLSLDLDNQWSYLKTHGDPAWVTLPSYFDCLSPHVLTFLAERQLPITFFVVGQDAAQPQHADLLGAIAEAGHEIGNHSYHHEPWLHFYSEAQIDETGVQPSLLLHPLDFLGVDDVQALAFFPGMHLSRSHKVAVVNAALRLLTRHFSVIPMCEHARQVITQSTLPTIDAQASFAQSGVA